MDTCTSVVGTTDWNPIAAAGPESAFAAVLAGFVFIGMVYVLTEGFDRHHGATLILFTAAFVCLAAASYIGTLISGEVACLRAWSESMFSSGLLTVGSTAIFGALTWLLPTRYGRDPLVRRFAISCALLVAVISAELIATAAKGYLLDMPGRAQWRDWIGWFTWVGMGLVVIAWLVGRIDIVQERHRVTIAASCVIAFVFANLALLGPIGDRPKDQWVLPPTWVVLTSTLVPLLGATIVVSTIVWALPTARSWPKSGRPRARLKIGGDVLQRRRRPRH